MKRKKCESCKHRYINYLGKKAVEIELCKKKRLLIGKIFGKCKYYEKYIPNPYIEKNTKCDNCECLDKCKENNRVIEVTRLTDTRKHYTKILRGCPKEGYEQ